MIQIIAGKKGSGKTKRLIDMTNNASKEADQNMVVFVDDDARYSRDIDRNVRFTDASEYNVKSPELLLGFLAGMLSANFDISKVFVDAFVKLYNADLAGAEGFFKALDELGRRHNVDFILCVSADSTTLPMFMKGYII